MITFIRYKTRDQKIPVHLTTSRNHLNERIYEVSPVAVQVCASPFFIDTVAAVNIEQAQ
jgi:hypothetical protein